MNDRNKTVYVLGAGFSIEAGAPSQENLIKLIFEISREEPNTFTNSTLRKFHDFLSNTLNIPEEHHERVPLEDIFTPLDKCISENLSFRNLTVKEVIETRELVYYLIGKALQVKLRRPRSNYIKAFAERIVDKCRHRSDLNYRNIDSVSIISTNWDILVDNALKSEIEDNPELGVVDYCCHISSFNEHDESVKPGLEILGRGGYNVKLIKLHGSLNWLQCPKCSRVYVDFYSKIAMRQYQQREPCRHCNKNFGYDESNVLVSNLIMPTYLKKLTNAQYRSIWKAAETEISEATKIVFVGYSLPFADFEMRQLLSRMVRKNAEIEVVDYGNPMDQKIIDLKNKYDIFFGRRNKIFHLGGTSNYVLNEME